MIEGREEVIRVVLCSSIRGVQAERCGAGQRRAVGPGAVRVGWAVAAVRRGAENEHVLQPGRAKGGPPARSPDRGCRGPRRARSPSSRRRARTGGARQRLATASPARARAPRARGRPRALRPRRKLRAGACSSPAPRAVRATAASAACAVVAPDHHVAHVAGTRDGRASACPSRGRPCPRAADPPRRRGAAATSRSGRARRRYGEGGRVGREGTRRDDVEGIAQHV